MKKLVILSTTHLATLVLGFALGIYMLPILMAPDSPSQKEVESLAANAQFSGEFRRNLRGSDLFHWGEGKLSIDANSASFDGKIAPGPDYKLYLTGSFVEDEESFLKIKNEALKVGDVKTFNKFIVRFPQPVNLSEYNTAVVWCESFSEFITAAKFR